MCNKCLVLVDDDSGIEWMPMYAGVGIYTGSRPKHAVFSPYAKVMPVNLNKIRFGEYNSDMTGWKRRPPFKRDERIEFEEGKEYTARELEQLADQLLRDDAREVDPDTGKERGIGGDNPILFPEHIYQRQKREILNENGVPEPGLVRGIYYRSHPEGRKVNSEEQRKKHGASYFR